MGFFDKSNKVTKVNTDVPSKERRPRSSPATPQASQSPPPASAGQNQRTPISQPFPQPWGFASPPPQWSGSPPVGLSPASPYPYPIAGPPIIVNQNYFLPPMPSAAAPPRPSGGFSLDPLVDLADQMLPAANFPQLLQGIPTSWPPASYGGHLASHGTAIYDQLANRFGDIMTLIDGGKVSGNEGDLLGPAADSSGQVVLLQPVPSPPAQAEESGRSRDKKSKKDSAKEHHKGQTTAVAASVISGNHFAKVDLYANARLPMDLPHLKLYMPTYPLLCLAAQYAERVYEKPKGAERDAQVDSDWRTGAKATVIKSVPMDHMNTIVFAVRGTATFMDWAVNLNMAPSSPEGFLDDPGNLCHTGFLSVARRMVRPVAARLRQLLEEDPSRKAYSLLITGHSAGGAIGALLYCHMLAAHVESELTLLAGCFRRIHCVTFGAPPVSLLPLQKPSEATRPELAKSMFFSFINEGDPVARADKTYVRSLLEAYAAPAPLVTVVADKPASDKPAPSRTSPRPEKAAGGPSSSSSRPKDKKSKSSPSPSKSAGGGGGGGGSGGSSSKASKTHKHTQYVGPVWPVPHSTLSCAGRIVVLRSGDHRRGRRKTVEERLDEGVVAQVVTDEELRGVIWGDPVCHVMKLYAGRIETLAVGAVTAQGH